jgi:hypothetical protein
MSCEKCAKACLSCYGPTNSECLTCNYPRNYSRVSPDSRVCQLVECSEGTYLELIEETKFIHCVFCHESCQSCKSYNKCLECKKGYIRPEKPSVNNSWCITCSEGYIILSSGKCQGKT